MKAEDGVPPHSEHVSGLLRQMKDTAAREDVITVGNILQLCGVRGFAFLLLALALLNIVIFMVPFISILFGLPMVILAAQLVIGLRAPIFPAAIRHRTIRREPFVAGIDRAIRAVEVLERFIKPRFRLLSDPRLARVHGIAALVMSIMVALPIPVVNVPPSLGLVMLSLGILTRDGIFILIGYAIGVWCLWLFKSLGHIAHAVAKSA